MKVDNAAAPSGHGSISGSMYAKFLPLDDVVNLENSLYVYALKAV